MVRVVAVVVAVAVAVLVARAVVRVVARAVAKTVGRVVVGGGLIFNYLLISLHFSQTLCHTYNLLLVSHHNLCNNVCFFCTFYLSLKQANHILYHDVFF